MYQPQDAVQPIVIASSTVNIPSIHQQGTLAQGYYQELAPPGYHQGSLPSSTVNAQYPVRFGTHPQQIQW